MTDLPYEIEEYADSTFSELVADDDTDYEQEDIEEFKEGGEEFMRLAQIIFTAQMMGEMFVNDRMTLEEYWRITEYLEEKDAKLGKSVI